MILHKIDNNKEILLNKMYVGEYLIKNIGHEAINLLRADDGTNYIYINAYGTMEKEHNGKTDTVVLVRNAGIPNTLEVLAQAWGLEQVAKIEQSSREQEIQNLYKEQIKYIKDNNVTYCGKLLNQIYDKNLKNDDDVYITFKAKEIRRPKRRTFITFCTDKEILPFIDKETCHLVYLNELDKKETASETVGTIDMARASLKMYIKNGIVKKEKNRTFPNRKYQNQVYAFKQLQNLLEDGELWQNVNTTATADTIKKNKLNEYNFIDLVDKQYAEVTYSNLFQHIFESSPELFAKFADEVLSVDNLGNKIANEDGKILNISKNIKVKREEGHIDILIEDKENVIVIENKIKSDINGEKYNIYGELITDQLRDYYYYVNGNKRQGDYYVPDKELENKYANKNSFFYIFAPDYNQINEARLEKNVLLGCVKYIIINYSRIYDFFNRYKKDYSDKIPYYNEFLYALSKHTDLVDNVLEKEMQNRFANIIG